MKNKLRNFSSFLEEVSIKGNEGIPGEGPGDDKKYLDEVERRARERVGVQRDEDPRTGMPRQTMEAGRELMDLLNRSMSAIRGKEDELEKLAKDIILSQYGTILDNVDLDIKLVRPGEVKDFMDDEDGEPEPEPTFQLLNDPEIKKEVDKRKIINNITQGEAKNTKRILAMPEVRDGIKEIFGESKGDEIHTMWSRMTELADKMDWLVPVEIKGDMMERNPEGLAGAVSVKWPEAEEDEDLASKVLKSLEEDGDISDDDSDIEELLSTGNPIIKARGVDFPMLLHETVKGIYELIAAAGIPEDKRTAELVMMNTSSFEDEAEEFRYGPEIAADLRDFINASDREVTKYPNIREHVCGILFAMDKDEFLITMKNILLNSPDGRKEIDQIIDDVIKSLDEYELDQALPGNREEEDDYREEPSNSFADDILGNISNGDEEEDLSKYSKFEIQKMMDDALDNKDYDEARRLHPYLTNEGKIIFLKEMERINENSRKKYK